MAKLGAGVRYSPLESLTDAEGERPARGVHYRGGATTATV